MRCRSAVFAIATMVRISIPTMAQDANQGVMEVQEIGFQVCRVVGRRHTVDARSTILAGVTPSMPGAPSLRVSR